MRTRKTARSGIQGVFGVLVSLLVTFPFVVSAVKSHSSWDPVFIALGYTAIGLLIWWVWRIMKQMDVEIDADNQKKEDQKHKELIEAMREQTRAIVAALQKVEPKGHDEEY